MKRSEARRYIECEMDKRGTYCDHIMSEDILEVVEAMGMKPPCKEPNDFYSTKNIHDYCWEPEDD